MARAGARIRTKPYKTAHTVYIVPFDDETIHVKATCKNKYKKIWYKTRTGGRYIYEDNIVFL